MRFILLLLDFSSLSKQKSGALIIIMPLIYFPAAIVSKISPRHAVEKAEEKHRVCETVTCNLQWDSLEEHKTNDASMETAKKLQRTTKAVVAHDAFPVIIQVHSHFIRIQSQSPDSLAWMLCCSVNAFSDSMMRRSSEEMLSAAVVSRFVPIARSAHFENWLHTSIRSLLFSPFWKKKWLQRRRRSDNKQSICLFIVCW